VSPFRPSFSPQPRVFPPSPRALSPLSTAFTPNRSLTPLSTGFTQRHRGVGGWTSYYPLLTTHYPLSSSFVFITLRNPFPANPLYSHPYKTPGVPPLPSFLSQASRPLCLCALRCLPTAGRQIPSFQELAASFPSLCPLLRTRSLCFQSFAASFRKTPGGGV
jgi:hypothetical protein